MTSNQPSSDIPAIKCHNIPTEYATQSSIATMDPATQTPHLSVFGGLSIREMAFLQMLSGTDWVEPALCTRGNIIREIWSLTLDVEQCILEERMKKDNAES